MQILKGSYTPTSGGEVAVVGNINCLNSELRRFEHFDVNVLMDGYDPIYSEEAGANEITVIYQDYCKFDISFDSGEPDQFGKKYVISGEAYFSSETYNGTSATGIIFKSIKLRIFILENINGDFSQTGTAVLIAGENVCAISEGTYSSNSETLPVDGYVGAFKEDLYRFGQFDINIFTIQGSPIYSKDASFNEITMISGNSCKFDINFDAGDPDQFGKKYTLSGTAYFSSDSDNNDKVCGVTYYKIEIQNIFVLEEQNGVWGQVGSYSNIIAECTSESSGVPSPPTGVVATVIK